MEEIEAVSSAIRSGTLTSTKGRFTKALEGEFAGLIGTKFAFACSSGSAAMHVAIAALDLEPGAEVVTTAITDMGAIAPILFQGAIPVFADVDPHSALVTAATVAAAITPRTGAIVVTHLFGNPCEMRAILHVAAAHGLPVIEDCAQAFLAESDGARVGRLGTISAFSLQQGKHITTGEGGLVVTADPDLARRSFLFINKAWGYGDKDPDHYFIAPNYRMNELTAAVALAQLKKLPAVVERRVSLARRLNERLRELAGIGIPRTPAGSMHTYWKYVLNVDEHAVRGGAVGLGGKLAQAGLSCAPRYIQKPAFECAAIRDQQTFGRSRWPFTLAHPDATDYSRSRFPGTYQALNEILVLPWNERYTEGDVDYIADVICRSHAELTAPA
ncbi:MAG: DegT/DnrJ/EryC1/StrS family aminotransferase [Vulcanimicrobiaceae bacterium]